MRTIEFFKVGGIFVAQLKIDGTDGSIEMGYFCCTYNRSSHATFQ